MVAKSFTLGLVNWFLLVFVVRIQSLSCSHRDTICYLELIFGRLFHILIAMKFFSPPGHVHFTFSSRDYPYNQKDNLKVTNEPCIPTKSHLKLPSSTVMYKRSIPTAATLINEAASSIWLSTGLIRSFTSVLRLRLSMLFSCLFRGLVSAAIKLRPIHFPQPYSD